MQAAGTLQDLLAWPAADELFARDEEKRRKTQTTQAITTEILYSGGNDIGNST